MPITVTGQEAAHRARGETSYYREEVHFRLVRESYTQVRDSHIHVQARYTGSGESTEEITAAPQAVPAPHDALRA